MPTQRVRESVEVLQDEYEKGNKTRLDNLVRAFEGIINKDPADDLSFHKIAGFHGAPFRGAGWGNSAWWGGYCHHGNVLFPTWHRAYLLRLEDALRSVPGCADVTLPYWDELSPASIAGGVPWCFLQPKWTLDDAAAPGGTRELDNPLRSYKFRVSVWDNVNDGSAATDYTKKRGYETVRYPFSGLVGPADLANTERINAELAAKGIDATNAMLNTNVVKWLGREIRPTPDGPPLPTNSAEKYRRCLLAPNYTVFSNTTSAMQWNEEHFDVTRWRPGAGQPAADAVVPLEAPHNDLHLAVGGFEIPGQGDVSESPGANGDMGENDTAAFDPIFYFHHCYVDKVFWDWQVLHNATDKLEIIKGYPGTNSVDAQGPTPGVAANSWLDMDSPLDPFEIRLGTDAMFKSRVSLFFIYYSFVASNIVLLRGPYLRSTEISSIV
jgi:tyrosinase